MALKLNIDISHKVGMPDHGSASASCSHELELDAGLLECDPDSLQPRIRQGYEDARQAVHDELVRLQALPAERDGLLSPSCPVSLTQDDGFRPTGGDGPRAPAGNNRMPSRRPATASQVRVILAIARRCQADLKEVLRQEFEVEKPEELSLRQASRLIDRLKAPR